MCKSKNRYFYHIFVSPEDAPGAITLNVAWMKRQFSACQTPRSMYPSIFNSFPVIRTASAKNRRFYVPQPTFSPWRRPCDYHAIYVACMERQFNACQTPRSMYQAIFNSFRVIRSQCVNRRFHVPQPTFLFPLETPLRMRLSRNLLHGWKENSMLAKPLTAFTYLYLIVSELYDA